MPKVTLGDVEIFYATHGAGSPLLLVPGLGGVGSYWNANIRHFRESTGSSFTIIAAPAKAADPISVIRSTRCPMTFCG
jgi:hypothetical protein